MELVSDKEFDIIQQFKKKRDALAHWDGLFFPNYSEAQKHELSTWHVPQLMLHTICTIEHSSCGVQCSMWKN
jgi:hypothetical protein